MFCRCVAPSTITYKRYFLCALFIFLKIQKKIARTQGEVDRKGCEPVVGNRMEKLFITRKREKL